MAARTSLFVHAGVSNFGIDELSELLAMARIKPALVQRNSDPLSADTEVQALCRMAGMQYQVRKLQVTHGGCKFASSM
jgi:diketogulonate reductase-like aldo/keto reductase